MQPVKNIHVLEYANYTDTDHILIDVREVDEYDAGHLPGAVNMPMSTFADHIDEIPEGKTVILVCQSGGRSLRVGQFLAMQERNYIEVVNLDGGTIDWVVGGNPVEK